MAELDHVASSKKERLKQEMSNVVNFDNDRFSLNKLLLCRNILTLITTLLGYYVHECKFFSILPKISL